MPQVSRDSSLCLVATPINLVVLFAQKIRLTRHIFVFLFSAQMQTKDVHASHANVLEHKKPRLQQLFIVYKQLVVKF